MVLVRRPGSTPRLTVALACGSRSMRRTRRLLTARQAARLTAVVVFPHPPFWFTRASRRAVGLLSPSTASLPTTRALVHIRRGHRPRPPAQFLLHFYLISTLNFSLCRCISFPTGHPPRDCLVGVWEERPGEPSLCAPARRRASSSASSRVRICPSSRAFSTVRSTRPTRGP